MWYDCLHRPRNVRSIKDRMFVIRNEYITSPSWNAVDDARLTCQRSREILWCRRHCSSSYRRDYTIVQASRCRSMSHSCFMVFSSFSFLLVQLRAFPTVGSSAGWLGSWLAGIKYMTNAADIIQEGYKKASISAHIRYFDQPPWYLQHKGAPFKIATFYHWVVIVTSRAHVEELRDARDDEFSLLEAANEVRSAFLSGCSTRF